MKNHNNKVSQSHVNDLLSGERLESVNCLPDSTIVDMVAELQHYYEQKVFNLYNGDNNIYLQTLWQHLSGNEEVEEVINLLSARISFVYDDIVDGEVSISEKIKVQPFDYEKQHKSRTIDLLKMQSSRLKQKIEEINHNMEGVEAHKDIAELKNIYDGLYSEEKKKQVEEYVKKKKEQKLQREKRLNEVKKKEEQQQQKKAEQLKEEEQKEWKKKMQIILELEKERHEKRKQENQIRQQRNTQYIKLRRSYHQKPPLYQRFSDVYSQRYEKSENEKKQKIHTERKSVGHQLQLEKIKQHQKKYTQMRLQLEKERKDRRVLQEEEQKSRLKYHSSYQLQRPVDEKAVRKEQAKNKYLKMKEYKTVLREKFQPKIDEQKRKQMMNLIEEMDLHTKRVKRMKLNNGSVVYEELRNVDPKIIGMEYLERVKQMAEKNKSRRKSSSDLPPPEQVKKPINYLHQMRKEQTKKERKSFFDRSNLSYDEKLKRVMLESDRLAEETKQAEMKLKYGKFKTSQQILACKEQIDQNYIDIVNMKLKLIQKKEKN